MLLLNQPWTCALPSLSKVCFSLYPLNWSFPLAFFKAVIVHPKTIGAVFLVLIFYRPLPISFLTLLLCSLDTKALFQPLTYVSYKQPRNLAHACLVLKSVSNHSLRVEPTSTHEFPLDYWCFGLLRYYRKFHLP